MMEPHATKFADAEKVPRIVLPVVPLAGPIHLFEAIAENAGSHQPSRKGALNNQITTGRRGVMARNRLQTLVSANVRFGSKADICTCTRPCPLYPRKLI
jgi:hypothetical protein